MRKTGPPKGLIAYLMLELLDEKPRYGYEILKEIKSISGGHWEPSYGSVYPILYKFEEKGWANRIERDDEPERKYFELTDEGREKLEEKRSSGDIDAKDFVDVILGFYHVFVTFATDDRLKIDVPEGEWRFDEEFSAWIIEQLIRHHERDFDVFRRIADSPETFYERMDIEPH